MNCPVCKAKMIKGKTNMPYELAEDRVIVIKDVPALICPQCGEIFIEATVLREVEKLIDSAEKGGMVLGFILYHQAA